MNFNDLITSFRGIGIIGGTASLIVVACFIGFGMLALDKRFAGGETKIEFKIAENKKLVDNLNERIGYFSAEIEDFEAMKAASDELATVKVSLQQVRDKKMAAQSKVVSVQEGIIEAEEMFETYKRQYRAFVREGAIGKKFEKLITLDGKSYESAEIKSIGAMGMSITHRDGSCRIPFKELPLEMQKYYQFDVEEAEAQQRLEADRRRQHQLAHQATERAESRERDRNDAIREREVAREKMEDILKLEGAIRNLDARIYNMQTQIDAERHKTISRAPILRQDLDKLIKARAGYEAKLSQLRSAR